MGKHYTGVGSRETPKETGELITKIAIKLEELGTHLGRVELVERMSTLH